MRFIEYDGEVYELALRICEDTNDFYFNSPLWTNDELLNENVYDINSVSNSKYKAFIENKTDSILLIMNNNTMKINIKKDTLLNTFNGPTQTVTSDQYVHLSQVSPFGFNRTGFTETYNYGLSINYKYGTIYCTRLGIILNNEPLSDPTNAAVSGEGLGIYGQPENSSGGGHYGHIHQWNAGHANWNNCGLFYKALVYVKVNDPDILIKQNDKYYGVTQNEEDDNQIVEVKNLTPVSFVSNGYHIYDDRLMSNLFANGDRTTLIKHKPKIDTI